MVGRALVVYLFILTVPSSWNNHCALSIVTSSFSECKEPTEERLYFELFLDSNPLETGYSLICSFGDGEFSSSQQELWSVQSGALLNSEAGSWISESACIATGQTRCIFTLIDSAGNGLDSSGFYALKMGNKIIALSDYGTTEVFAERKYCVGIDCDLQNDEENTAASLSEVSKLFSDEALDMPPTISDQGVNPELKCTGPHCGAKPCVPFLFELNLDARPLETSATIVCDPGIDPLWNFMPHSTSVVEEFEYMSYSGCVSSCCQLNLIDSNITSPFYGFVNLQVNDGEIIFRADGQSQRFDNTVIDFGLDCS